LIPAGFMDIISTILIAFGLAMDCFAVSLSTGLCNQKVPQKDIVRMGLFFGGFQAGMTLIGYFFGSLLQKEIQGIDHWIAFMLLAILGIRMIHEACTEKEEEKCTILNIKKLTMLSIATSIDALAVGVSFAMISYKITFPTFMIGFISFGMAIIGGNLGKRTASHVSGKGAEIVGGLVLIGIGIKILFEHIGG